MDKFDASSVKKISKNFIIKEYQEFEKMFNEHFDEWKKEIEVAAEEGKFYYTLPYAFENEDNAKYVCNKFIKLGFTVDVQQNFLTKITVYWIEDVDEFKKNCYNVINSEKVN